MIFAQRMQQVTAWQKYETKIPLQCRTAPVSQHTSVHVERIQNILVELLISIQQALKSPIK